MEQISITNKRAHISPVIFAGRTFFFLIMIAFIIGKIILTGKLIKNQNQSIVKTDIDIITNLNISIIILALVFFIPYFLTTTFHTTITRLSYYESFNDFVRDVDGWISSAGKNIAAVVNAFFSKISRGKKINNNTIVGFFFLVLAIVTFICFILNGMNLKVINEPIENLQINAKITIYTQMILAVILLIIFLFCSIKYFLLV